MPALPTNRRRERVIGGLPLTEWSRLAEAARRRRPSAVAGAGAVLAAAAAVAGTLRRIAADSATPEHATPTSVTAHASVVVNRPAPDVRRLAEAGAAELRHEPDVSDVVVSVDELPHERGSALHVAMRVLADRPVAQERARAWARRTKSLAECGEVLVS